MIIKSFLKTLFLSAVVLTVVVSCAKKEEAPLDPKVAKDSKLSIFIVQEI
jgi:hypothetical protein